MDKDKLTALAQRLDMIDGSEDDVSTARIAADYLRQCAEVKPVAWMDDFGNAFPLAANKGAGSWLDQHKRTWKPLYTCPQPPSAQADALDALRRLERAVDWHLGRSAFTQTSHLKGLGHSNQVREELFAAHDAARAVLAAQADAVEVKQPVTDATIERISKALRRAFLLGQTYWQQADSDSRAQHKRADATYATFNQLVDETCAALAKIEGETK